MVIRGVGGEGGPRGRKKEREKSILEPTTTTSTTTTNTSGIKVTEVNGASIDLPPSVPDEEAVPGNGGGHGGGMPEAVGVDGVPKRGKVEQLQAHGEAEPGDDEAGCGGPELL